MIVAVASILFEAALRALIAACALWAGLRLLRVKNVGAQKAAWSIVLLAAVAMPVFIAGAGHWLPAWAQIRLPAYFASSVAMHPQAPANLAQSGTGPVEQSASLPESAPLVTPTAGSRDGSDTGFETPPDTSDARTPFALPPVAKPIQTPPVKTRPIQSRSNQSRPIQAAPKSPSLSPRHLLAFAFLVYLGVAAALLLRWFFGLGSSIRLWLQAEPVQAAKECGMEGVLATRSSKRISSPANIGSGIILPADYSTWNTAKLRAVLAHERSHVQQRDFYLQLLAGFYAAITWFSPLGWWLKRKLSELSEAISDRAGVEESASSSAYAQLLLEFAALPRPTFTGVAMAHSTNLSYRIERLLNESTFKQAFTGSRRAIVTALIVPALLVAITSVVRVQAAQAPQSADATTPSLQSSDRAPALPADQPPVVVLAQSPSTGQSNAMQAVVLFSGQSPDQAPASSQPASVPSPDAVPAAAPAPPAVPVESQDSIQVVVPPIPPIDVHVDIPPIPPMVYLDENQGRAPCFADGDSYAIVGDPGTKTRFCGNWGADGKAEVEKARSAAHGPLLLFHHEGKYYVVDDPATVSQIEDMEKAMMDQGDKMRALGEQMRDMGKDERDAARKAREVVQTYPTPDLSKQLADLNAEFATLQANHEATITREQMQQIQHAINELQRRLISTEVKVDLDLDQSMGQFGAQQGEFGKQMGKLGAEMGRIAQENQQNISAIIDQSLRNGTAKPVN